MSFQIPNDSTTPMVDTHFFKWLHDYGSAEGHRIKDKKNYLTQLGFVYGEDKLSKEDLDILKGIHDHFYCMKLKGSLPPKERPMYVAGYDVEVKL